MLVFLVNGEERSLDRTYRQIERMGQDAEDSEKAKPLVGCKLGPAAIDQDDPDGMEKLPYADVEDPVSLRIQERKHGGCHRHRNTPKAEQGIEAQPLPSGAQSRGRALANAIGSVGPDERHRPRRFPSANRLQLPFRKVSTSTDGSKSLNEIRCGGVLVRDQMVLDQARERSVRQMFNGHGSPGSLHSRWHPLSAV